MGITRKISILLVLILFVAQAGAVDNNKQLPVDTLSKQASINVKPITINAVNDTSITLKPFKPDPSRVVWMGAIIPGYGQILNHKYWKLPIVYGGFLGCAYAISWNSGMYSTYLNAYRDIVDGTGTSYLLLIPKGRTIDSYGGTANFTTLLNTKQENYRRYRDLSIIALVGYYALTVVDAYVDAQLYDFDISPDLSMRLQPTVIKNDFGISNSVGFQCSINLK